MNTKSNLIKTGIGICALFAVLILLVNVGLISTVPTYDESTVSIYQGQTNAHQADVDVRIADTAEKRYIGLSNTEELNENEGMLFIHEEEGRQAYVMRDMNFPIDIIFISSTGEITEIHQAGIEENEQSLTRYEGKGRYVLEVPYGFAEENRIETGDTVVTEYNH